MAKSLISDKNAKEDVRRYARAPRAMRDPWALRQPASGALAW